jgi:CRISPR-associated protein Csm2
MSQLFPPKHRREKQPHEEANSTIREAASKLAFSSDPVPGDLFDSTARTIAEELANAKEKFNRPTQIRRFYDELVNWRQRIKDDEAAFKKYEAFIRMMNAKVAYAKGRELVDANFEHWFKEGIEATTSARALKHFQFHFEAVLGFLKGLRG